MKNIHLSVILLSACISSYAQNVNIPDATFKALLVGDATINTNGDGEIQISEVAAYTGPISVNGGISGGNISDLTGIEAFTSITELYCYANLLPTLDVSANTALTVIMGLEMMGVFYKTFGNIHLCLIK